MALGTCPDTGLTVGDTHTVVVTDANQTQPRDPITRVDGKIMFLRCPGDFTPERGDVLKARLADIGDTHLVAVVIARLEEEPVDE